MEGLGRISGTPESNGAWGWLGLENHGGGGSDDDVQLAKPQRTFTLGPEVQLN